MVPDILRVAAAEGAPIEEMPADIDHLGYDGDQTRKHQRNLPLLERQVLDDPDRIYLWFHLGEVREALGDATGAEAAWSRGVEVARRDDPPPVFALLGPRRGLRSTGSTPDAPSTTSSPTSCAGSPTIRSPRWVVAHDAMASARWADADPHARAAPARRRRHADPPRPRVRRAHVRRVPGALARLVLVPPRRRRARRALVRRGGSGSRPTSSEYAVKRSLAERRASSRPQPARADTPRATPTSRWASERRAAASSRWPTQAPAPTARRQRRCAALLDSPATSTHRAAHRPWTERRPTRRTRRLWRARPQSTPAVVRASLARSCRKRHVVRADTTR